MARRNRITLKDSFKSGKKPTEQDFENLIDSTLNILDDGFSKSPQTGIGLAPLLDKGTVISIFMDPGDQNPQWKIDINKHNRNLEIRRNDTDNEEPLLSLKPDGSVEIAQKGSVSKFGGAIQSPVREGNMYRSSVPADGKWYNITDELDGVQALEVVAVAGKQHTGKHAVLVATTTSCYGKRGKITKTRSNYGLYAYRLCIRWKKNTNNKNQLQLKTLFKYGDEMKIYYHIQSLWQANILTE